MEIPRDQIGGRRAGLSAVSDSVICLASLDWPGLTARLVAAHAARQILAFHPSPSDGAPASFAPDVARDMAGWRAAANSASSPDVNLDTKADGKSLGTIAANCAGEDRSIVQGLL